MPGSIATQAAPLPISIKLPCASNVAAGSIALPFTRTSPAANTSSTRCNGCCCAVALSTGSGLRGTNHNASPTAAAAAAKLIHALRGTRKPGLVGAISSR